MRAVCVAAALTGSFLLGVGGASGHAPGTILYGTGTAMIDGSLAPGEWDGARRIDFGANLPSHDGGGTIPTSIRAMNDGSKLYVSLEVGRATSGHTSFALYFDNDHDGTREQGDDAFLADVGKFSPVRFLDWHWTSCTPGGPGLHCPDHDASRGGTTDGGSAADIAGTKQVLEAWHPLDGADDGHDFSLGAGSVAGFAAHVRLFSADTTCNDGPTCYADTVVPIGIPSHGETGRYGHLVISPDLIPPETSFATGPAQGSTTSLRDVSFGLSGVDNLTPDERLSFSCSLDGAAFSSCGPQPAFAGLAEGGHRLEAQATDELGNVDSTPAVRQWTVDATAPETAITTGPPEGALTNKRNAAFALSGSDNLTPPDGLGFTCSVDGRAFSSCEASLVLQRLADGPHRLEARSVDAGGNTDQSPAVRRWRIDATPPSKPRVRVRVRGSVVRARLSAVDAAGGPVRYRCSVDGRRYRPCAASSTFRVKHGRHVLRAVALDRLGNRSATGAARWRTPARRH